jgi:hypothetical protein
MLQITDVVHPLLERGGAFYCSGIATRIDRYENNGGKHGEKADGTLRGDGPFGEYRALSRAKFDSKFAAIINKRTRRDDECKTQSTMEKKRTVLVVS